MSENPVGRPRQTTHDEIRRVAFGLFAERGYAATSLAQIAAGAGISRTTLFSYFPAKRDLLWEDHERALERLRDTLAEQPGVAVVDLLVAGMLAIAHYEPAEHAALAARRRIVQDDPDLRAHSVSRAEELVEMLVDACLRAHPGVDAELVDSVARALMAVASRCTEEWSLRSSADEPLDAFTARRLGPLAVALQPLLP
ncbi:TetR/AcrR family transcriptional regulator [Microbacterium terricola]|uniref:HTH tetR-type domain-containing protein n=1 Tax=Microbacterium terricola TaxID=344163 RepID=A0ABM8E1J0_9MICO|nr:TetR/AcrR family transcriptional regulator [Microbacterium terricola]UYK40454.1 TetR/AcrR family transcriptional regulator [Microbacterium terricola]BDV31824.1 hypothetical protein Microterr_24840 [Microbacterium terricola]